MARPLAFAAAFILLGLQAAAQNSATEIDNYVASEMQAQHIPGLSFALVHNGAIVQSGARGLANVELSAPASDVTEFAIASMSKSVTASAIMLLAQQGALSIDDRVGKYLAVPDSWKDMTIRQLLSHTAGVKDHFQDFPKYPPVSLDRRLSYSHEEYLKAHVDAPLNFAPGTEWAYSGGGYVILGAIIEKITGHPYGDFLRDRIFRPLGMEHTHIISITDIIPNRASGYWFRDGALRNGGYSGQAHISGPDVSVMTTATDLAKWMIAIAGARQWSAASRDAMWTPAHLADGREVVTFPAAVGYGLGWLIGNYGRYVIVGHGGTLVNGFTSAFFFLPQKQTGVIVLTNQYDANPEKIAFGILGRYDPDLRAPHDYSTQAEGEPAAATERAAAFATALFGGGDLSGLVTPGLLAHLSAMPQVASPAKPNPAPVFIAHENLTPPLQRYGESVVRLAFYKITFEGEDHWMTLYLTANGKIADLAAY